MLNLAEKTAHPAPELLFVITIDGIPYDDPEEVTQRLLEAIQRRAIAKWGVGIACAKHVSQVGAGTDPGILQPLSNTR